MAVWLLTGIYERGNKRVNSNQTTVSRLINKAKEAFVMAIEIYNKPSIQYRLEGFSFFICNAWELMLKAHIINKYGEEAVYYMDKKNRTISLENA